MFLFICVYFRDKNCIDTESTLTATPGKYIETVRKQSPTVVYLAHKVELDVVAVGVSWYSGGIV